MVGNNILFTCWMQTVQIGFNNYFYKMPKYSLAWPRGILQMFSPSAPVLIFLQGFFHFSRFWFLISSRNSCQIWIRNRKTHQDPSSVCFNFLSPLTCNFQHVSAYVSQLRPRHAAKVRGSECHSVSQGKSPWCLWHFSLSAHSSTKCHWVSLKSFTLPHLSHHLLLQSTTQCVQKRKKPIKKAGIIKLPSKNSIFVCLLDRFFHQVGEASCYCQQGLVLILCDK